MGEIGDSLLYYSTHEIVHAVKEISRESYEMMRDTVIDLMDITKEAWDRRIDEVIDRYGFKEWDGEASPSERAEEELICDRMPAAFVDKAFTNELVNRDEGSCGGS